MIAKNHYDYPLTDLTWNPAAVPTGIIGLLETGEGAATYDGMSVQGQLNRYRDTALGGGSSVPAVPVFGQEGLSTAFPKPPGERSLDIGIATTVDQKSPLVLYAGTSAGGSVFSTYQSAFWDDIYRPAVVSSSNALGLQSSAYSPFRKATLELFTDAALRNITVFKGNNDGGSSDGVANGGTNTDAADSSPYNVMVGGTSLSTLSSAEADPTLTAIVAAAKAGDPDILWELIAGGVTSIPSDADAGNTLIETVWNEYWVQDDPRVIEGPDGPTADSGYLGKNANAGGVDSTQTVPWYQKEFGLEPTTADTQQFGRGNADVAANAGGNMVYRAPSTTELGKTVHSWGTSAATPLWGALGAQLNAVFADQGLRQLGFMTDLLYMAAVVAPGAFNDVTRGNNRGSFVSSTGIIDPNNPPYATASPDQSGVTYVNPTDLGYSAQPGYDVVTGLGSPDGVLLARTLTQIAHDQVSFSGLPDVIESDGQAGWQSGVKQSLLFQTMDARADNIDVIIAGDSHTFTNTPPDRFAWTSRMAGKSLQPDFSPELVTMFDGQSQGTLVQAAEVNRGASIALEIATAATDPTQIKLSQSFGFADFMLTDGSSAVRVAQSVAVAETAGAQNDQHAVIRIRQGGQHDLWLELYRVDDYAGTVAGLAPGSAGYAAAADARAYRFEDGTTQIEGPGYGQFRQAEIAGVDGARGPGGQPDLIAMKLTNATTNNTYWAFAEANSDGGTPHLWNYGANLWGWEDLYGGGDRDYNDLVVQIDCISAAGHGILVHG